MATTIQGPASVELFYSYAHSDEPLCKELQKHLTALKRSGLIRDWYDRKIEPGDEWDAQIHDAMERAGIILLLVSADFLASKYIFEVELPFALERHDSGRARVIPILLRPVEWRDSPFAKLQILPSEARAVTLWSNQDEAFSDIAGRLRELLYTDRVRQVKPKNSPGRVAGITQERVLDAAIASSVVIDEPTDLVTMVRGTESGGLKAILQIDRSYSPTSDDVRSETFELEFPSDESGKVLPANLELVLESPGFDPVRQRKKIRVPPAGDSGVSVFMLTPKRAGTLRLNLQAVCADVEVGARALVTKSVAAAEAQPILSYAVTSLPLTRSIERYRLSNFVNQTPPAPRAAAPGPAPSLAPAAAMPRSRPRSRVWIGIGSSAAAIALVSTAVLWNGNNAARSPASINAPVVQVSPGITALNEAIKRQPTTADLYLKRAEEYQRTGRMSEALTDAERATELAPTDVRAHLSYARLLEKANLKDRALQEYKRVQSLKPSPAVRRMATQRAAELERHLSGPDR